MNETTRFSAGGAAARRRTAYFLACLLVTGPVWPSMAWSAEGDDADTVAYAYAVVSPVGPGALSATGVTGSVMEQVQAAAREWLIASGYAWSPEAPPLANADAARKCLTNAECRDKLSLENGLVKLAVIELETTPGGRLTLRLVVHTTLSGTMDMQWVAAFGAEGPGELFRSLPALNDALTVTLAILRMPASAEVRLNGWRIDEPAGDIVLTALLARPYDLVGTAPGYEDSAIPFVAEGPEPVQVRCHLARKKRGSTGLYVGVVAGAILVAGGVTAAVVLLLSRFKAPATELMHHTLY